MDGWRNTLMYEYSRADLTEKLIPVTDKFLIDLPKVWYEEKQQVVTPDQFILNANRWFKSSKYNTLDNWKDFKCIDIIMGCTQFIESLILKYGWDGIQILTNEYGYYGLMGKSGVRVDELKPEVPLIVSLPNFHYADLRPEWDDILRICEQRNIDIHIDFAWMTVAKDIGIDLGHPNIKSFAMSLSKYNCQWNRIGLRWSRQRSMDSITIMSRYYGDVNSGIISCGNFLLNRISRDYTWDYYGDKYTDICKNLDLIPTKLINVVRIKDQEKSLGIGKLLSSMHHAAGNK